MKPEEIAEIVEAEIVFCSPAWCQTDIHIGCSSDLMSDIHTILLVRSKVPSRGMLELAESCRISLMRTRHTMFTACGRLMNAGLKSPY